MEKDSNYKFITKATNAIADNYRLQIVLNLAKKGEMCCNDVQDLTKLSQPTCSHHLKLLIDSELINARKEGKHHFYSLNKEKFSLLSSFFKELS